MAVSNFDNHFQAALLRVGDTQDVFTTPGAKDVLLSGHPVQKVPFGLASPV